MVEQYSRSTGFFTRKHLYQPGDPIQPGLSYFTYDPSAHTLSIASTGETVVLDSSSDFVSHWLDPSRASVMWNSKYRTANIVVPEVGYGVTGSGTTMAGRFTSALTGLLVADALGDAHAFPVDPGGQAVHDLVPWPHVCACGAMKAPGSRPCLACQQRAAGSRLTGA